MLTEPGVVASAAVTAILTVVIVVAVLLLILVAASIVVVPEYYRAVVFRFGRLQGRPRGPGLVTRIPVVDKVVRVNLRVEVVDIPSQTVITQDNVTIAVDAVVYFQIVDPIRAVIGVDNFRFASQRIAMTSLRSIIGRYELDSLLAHREDVNAELRTVIARNTSEWGVDVRQVEVRDIQLPPELLRAMARQAEAERERRAKVIAATGELQASVELSEAADKLTASPGALQLRTLQTLAEIATENSSTLVFPIPVELLEALGVKRSSVPPAGAWVGPAPAPMAVTHPTPPSLEKPAPDPRLAEEPGSPPSGPGAVPGPGAAPPERPEGSG